MQHMRPLLALALATLGFLTSPCALTRTRDARQYLDRHSGATITTMGRPFIFAHERPSLAVNTRDYISIVAVDVNRAGQHQLYWYGYAWTTVTQRTDDTAPATAAGWLLLADGRPIALQAPSEAPPQLGIASPPISSPARDARVLMFLAEPDQLSYVAAAGTLSIQHTDGSDVFSMWSDARRELQGFLQRAKR